MKPLKFSASMWALLRPAPDMPGTWVSHCLNLDVMSQGSTVHEALENLTEAVIIAVGEDLARGRDPLVRGKKTPREDWDEQARISQLGARVDIGPLSTPKARAPIAVSMNVNLEFTAESPRALVEAAPPAWMIPARSGTRRTA